MTAQKSEGSRPAKKVVLVTGASRGIGRETATLLAANPNLYSVYGTYNSHSVTADELGGGIYLYMDQSDPQSISTVVSDIKSREGRLDVLVNNAGMGVYGPLEALSVEDIRWQIEVNLLGPMLYQSPFQNPLLRSHLSPIFCVGDRRHSYSYDSSPRLAY